MSRRPRLVEEGMPIDQDNVEMECSEISSSVERPNFIHSFTIPGNANPSRDSSSLSRAFLSHSHHPSTSQKGRSTRNSNSDFNSATEDSFMAAVEHINMADFTAWTNRSPSHPNVLHDQGIQTHFVVGCEMKGGDHRMEIEDILCKPPLLVLDGANIAYSYAQSFASASSASKVQSPDVAGIQIAVHYFLTVNYRVQVVIPTSWVRSKRHHPVLDSRQVEILHQLQSHNLLCFTPPNDDDDAYALAMARREDSRARIRKFNSHDGGPRGGAYLEGGAFVVSNDFYRDAMERDDGTSGLREWLEGIPLQNEHCGPPGRISYSFCDLGSIDRYGVTQLDFVPNPRHPLILKVEELHRKVPKF